MNPNSASGKIWEQILGRLEGGESRFTPEIMDRLRGGMRLDAESGAARATAEAQEGFQSRGLGRSSMAAGAERQIRTDLYSGVAQSESALARAKIDADYQDKSQAIDDGMNWLNSLRNYQLGMAATEAQREAAMANIALGRETLAQRMDELRERHAQELQRAGLGA